MRDLKRKSLSVNLKILIAVIAVVLLAGGVATIIMLNQNNKADNGIDNNNTSNVDTAESGNNIDASTTDSNEPDYDVLTSINSQDVLNFITNKDSGFIYVGRPTCPHCRIFAPILTKVVKQRSIDALYYDTDAANSDKDTKNEALDAINVNAVPSFLAIRSGEIIAELDDTESESALNEFVSQYPDLQHR